MIIVYDHQMCTFVIVQLMEIISNEETQPSLNVVAKVKLDSCNEWLLSVLLLGSQVNKEGGSNWET